MDKSEETIQEGTEEQVEESIRAWYARKTGKAIFSVIVASLIVLFIGLVVWVFAADWFILKLQIFNGAITIPAAGGIWLVSFTLVWLLPMREVSFRSFEAMENTRLQIRKDLETIRDKATTEIQEAKKEILAKVDEKTKPWFELGERLNKRFGPDFMDRLDKALRTAGELSEPAGPPPGKPARIPLKIPAGALAAKAPDNGKENKE